MLDVAGDLRGAGGETLRCELVRGGVREVARAVRPLRDAGRARRRLRHVAALADDDDALERPRPALRRLPATGLVGAEHRALDDGAGLLGQGEIERGVEKPGDRPAEAAGRPRDGTRGGANGVRVQLLSRPEACRGDARRSEPILLHMHERCLAELARHLAGRGEGLEAAAKRLVESAVLRQLGWLRHRDGEDVGLDRARRDDRDLDSHRGAMVSDRLSTLREMPRLRAGHLRVLADTAVRMSAAALRPVAPRRFRRERRRLGVEALQVRVATLALERQELRARDAAAAALERNRVALARAQWELSHALIDQYRPPEPREHAA